jgi:hypothetical protein
MDTVFDNEQVKHLYFITYGVLRVVSIPSIFNLHIGVFVDVYCLVV